MVSDGTGLGHPCCGEHDCQDPLPTQRSLFCRNHVTLKDICAVTTCSNLVEPGLRTCSLTEHRGLETICTEQNRAMFQLRKRLDRINTTQIEDSLVSSVTSPADDEVVEVDDDGVCEGKATQGSTKLRARFGRRRTHNEQLCVTTCGVIVGRATFFGSEGPYGVLVSAVHNLDHCI
jgi:hypothetical protein